MIIYSKEALVSQILIKNVAFEFIDNYLSVALIVENQQVVKENIEINLNGKEYPSNFDCQLS